MTRQEFIAELRKELRKLPPEEIVAATEYYEEYFDEVLEHLELEGLTEEEAAGRRAKAEAELINEMGSPKALAREIRADYAARILEGEVVSLRKSSVGNRISAVWWVLIGVVTAPVSIPVTIGLAGLLIGLLGGLFGLFMGLVAGLVGSITLAVLGIVSMFTVLPTGVMFLGAGLAGAAFCAAAICGVILVFRAVLMALSGQVAKLREKRKKRRLEQEVR